VTRRSSGEQDIDDCAFGETESTREAVVLATGGDEQQGDDEVCDLGHGSATSLVSAS